MSIPKLRLNSGYDMPVIGMGTSEFPVMPEKMKPAYLEAIKAGYRHFDTAYIYGSEKPLGEAIKEAIELGLIGSRGELFITSKIWCTHNHPELVLPALKSCLGNLQMEYLDLYLIHWPITSKPGPPVFPIRRDDIVPMDLKGVWAAMEEGQRLGLSRSIGVSNFTTKKLRELLSFARIPPAINQVEMNPSWQQQKLKEYRSKLGIYITAYSPLGGQSPSHPNHVLSLSVLKEISASKGRSVAQISLRWLYEQGVSIVVKSFKKERLVENLKIFDWELTDEELLKISTIPQGKRVTVESILTKEGSLNSLDLEDIEIIEN